MKDKKVITFAAPYIYIYIYAGIKTVTNSSKTIKNIINDKNNGDHIKFDAGVVSILCLG